ncbi:hypothetical protein [Spirosoma sordidisoli]|uniref:Uncharacterized protein n=1 Tax=Spirosoma sordidisoli TaxID=2502893 RepID=A0A4Q2UJF7_9BACT|nr:hypothetical protein [Spirosoma sordidisoli]RYC69617.1 hypothetical protein EQG79_13520 [Spirosoma sordidisoli]
MEATPKYFILDRRLIGVVEVAKRMVEAAAGASAVSDYPWVALVLIVFRVGLSGIGYFSLPKNPINVNTEQTVSIATEPKADAPSPDL